jgi:activator of 2-hydroxyglutaryl-CoA dehydratase
MYQHYLGVDLHSKRTYLVLMDAEGQVQARQRMNNEQAPAKSVLGVCRVVWQAQKAVAGL